MDPYDPEFASEEGTYSDDPDYDPGHDPVYGNSEPGTVGYDPNFDDNANVYDDNVILNGPYHDDPAYDVKHEIPGHHAGIYADADPYHDDIGGDDDDDDDDLYLGNNDVRSNERAQTDVPSFDPKDGQQQSFRRNCIFCCTCFLLIIGIIVLAVRINKMSDEKARSRSPNGVKLRPPPADLALKCTKENVASEQGLFECEELCEPSDCCDYPSSLALSCLAGNNEECLKYHEHCSVLGVDASSQSATGALVPDAPSDIKTTCSDENLSVVQSFEKCASVCMQAPCCWKKDGSVPPCTSNPKCQAFAPCLSLDANDHLNTKITAEIEIKCADTNLQTEVGRNQCIFACSHVSCCFDPNESCPPEDLDFCSQYVPCGHIYNNQGEVIAGGASSPANEVPTAPEFLSTACSKSSLNTRPGT